MRHISSWARRRASGSRSAISLRLRAVLALMYSIAIGRRSFS
jgi:hypothetical protein